MKKIIKLCVLFIVLSIKSNGQGDLSKLIFKNSIMYQGGKKVYSYKPNGEIILFNSKSDKNEIEGKMVVITLSDIPLKIDTLNLDSLYYKLRAITKGVGINKSWMLKATYSYHKNGKVKESIQYTDFGKTAISSNFDDTERLIAKGNYIHYQKKDGEWLKYDENGKVRKKQNYVNGVLIENTEYDENGVIINTTIVENGTSNSEQQQWRAKVIADSMAHVAQLQFNSSQNSNISNEEVFSVVEEMPAFVGGEQGKTMFIQQKLQYPQSAKDAGVTGICYVKFTVTSIGTLKDVQLLKGISGCKECGDEAIRVIKSMPNWKPGKQNGKAVSVSMNQAVKFQ